MKEVFHKIEHSIDKAIPYLVFILLGILIVTFFYHDLAEKYHSIILAFDYLIISFFAVDLIFKYLRVRKIKPFIKKYWLDIIAVFPFYLCLRLLEEVFLLFMASGTIKEGQSLLHLGAGAEEVIRDVSKIDKETGKIITEANKIRRFSRTRFMVRFFRPITRIPRLIKIIPYFEKTTGKHHPHD